MNIGFVARNSLRLDMEKRGVRRSSEERNFLGFKCNNKGIIETNIKGGFGVASDWPQLNKLAGKLRVSLTFENVEVEELMDAGNAVLLYENGDVIRYSSNKVLRKKLMLQQLETELSDIKQLKIQGTLIDLPNTDYLLSQDIFRNTNWPDKLVIFWFKMRHNVTACNYTLSLWYGSSPTCALDGYRLESMANLLNGCKKIKDVYSSRHDKIVSKLAIELGPFWNEIHVNKCVSSSLPFVSQDDLLSLKPDVVLLKGSDCVIAEASCPHDLYANEVYDEKRRKYAALSEEIERNGFRCSVKPVIVGSTGSVHKMALPNLMQMGLPKKQGKGLCKWFSNSNILVHAAYGMLDVAMCWTITELLLFLFCVVIRFLNRGA